MAKNDLFLLPRNNELYLRQTPTRGRGVFCRKAVRAGQQLEVTPGLILGAEATAEVSKTKLRDYVFAIGKISKALAAKAGIKTGDDSSCVVMGIVSFCNHSDSPNAEVLWEERKGTVYFTLRATKSIAKDTEICTSYGPTWFEDRDRAKA